MLITGVSRGIGEAVATHLLELGWGVFGVDVRDCELRHRLSGFWQGNVAEEKFWAGTVVPALKDERLEGIVNNAAVQPCNPISATTIEEWNDTLAVNVGSAFLSTKHLVPLMGSQGGSIVNVSSVHALATSPGMAAYVASKGALLSFTRAAALELATSGIRVNAVLPGATNTLMLADGLERNSKPPGQALHDLASRTPLGRIGEALEVAYVVEFLLDPTRSSFITGQSFTVDGGVLARLSSE